MHNCLLTKYNNAVFASLQSQLQSPLLYFHYFKNACLRVLCVICTFIVKLCNNVNKSILKTYFTCILFLHSK